jgi:hypothetical protein
MTQKVANKKTYATPRNKVLKLEVEFILDTVPGAFRQPIGLMRWIANNPYVVSVDLKEEE